MSTANLFHGIRTLIFDVNGVLTPRDAIILPRIGLNQRLNDQDQRAISEALATGCQVAIISAGKSTTIFNQLKALGVHDIYGGVRHKADAFEELRLSYDFDPQQTLYMGDSSADLEVMQLVGLSACPKDADVSVRNVANYISPFEGGRGCVHDVISKILTSTVR